MLKLYQEPIIQHISNEWTKAAGVILSIKREDLIHPFVSGNKWRKLKYNLEEARELGHSTLLTFGGAYSNHIYATAAAAQEVGFASIGIIRGEELENKPLNKTLSFAKEKGMKLHFVSRESYREKATSNYINSLKSEFGEFYLIPEGGTNMKAIKGCEEIMSSETKEYDHIVASVGTGGTLAGIIAASANHQNVLGISSLKGGFLKKEVSDLLKSYGCTNKNWKISEEYNFGGYAKTTTQLMNFIKNFELEQRIPLDQVYTGKMMYAVFNLIEKGYFPQGSKILTIHTGGLQGKAISS